MRWPTLRSPRALAVAAALALGSLSQTSAAGAASLDIDVTRCLLKARHVIQLGSPVFGVLGQVFVDRADRVTRGQIVARLDTSIEEAQVALDKHRASVTATIEAVRADMRWNQRELDRRRKLAGNMFSKANDMDEIQSKIEQDQISIRKAEDDLQVAKLEFQRSTAQLEAKVLKSPLDGYVTELKLGAGEFVFEQTPIMTIAQVDPLQVELVLPSSQFGKIANGGAAMVHLNLPVDREFQVSVDMVDKVIDPASGTFRVRLLLPNPDAVIPAGVRCSVRLATAEAAPDTDSADAPGGS